MWTSQHEKRIFFHLFCICFFCFHFCMPSGNCIHHLIKIGKFLWSHRYFFSLRHFYSWEKVERATNKMFLKTTGRQSLGEIVSFFLLLPVFAFWFLILQHSKPIPHPSVLTPYPPPHLYTVKCKNCIQNIKSQGSCYLTLTNWQNGVWVIDIFNIFSSSIF